jgi:hypothetical protein
MGRNSLTSCCSEQPGDRRLAVEGAHSEESLPLRGLHALAPWAWRLLVAMVVLLAVYVAAGRYLMSEVAALREPLLAALNQRLPFTVSAAQISGGWSAFSPELYFRELRVTQGDETLPPVLIRRGALCLDIPASIASGTLQLSRLEVDGLSLDARLARGGQHRNFRLRRQRWWRVAGTGWRISCPAWSACCWRITASISPPPGAPPNWCSTCH